MLCASMSNATCHVIGSNKVEVLDEYEFVDYATRHHYASALEQGSVWSSQVSRMRHMRFLPYIHEWLNFDWFKTAGHGIAGQAQKMALLAAKEKEDVLHAQWKGPEGQDPLDFLLQESDVVQQAALLMALAEQARDIVSEESTIQEVSLPATVFGDLHGQFRDMLLLFQDFGFPEAGGHSWVFNGDWVDRGKHQLEVVTLVLALKVACPDNVFLNRGNHEFPDQNKHGGATGFYEACKSRFGPDLGDQVFASFHDAFEYLPLGSLIGEKILVLHGGIGDGQWNLAHFEYVQRPLNNDQCSEDNVLYNVLWSDPLPEKSEESFGAHSSPRDGHANMVHDFGKDITQKFCQRNGLLAVVRSHQEKARGCGYEVMHGGQLIRVFSARDYEGMDNDGCILRIWQSSLGMGDIIVQPQVIRSLVKHKSELQPKGVISA
eukprot:gnl/MRDRNA2_/MRDRNA2_57142_c0_seq1.p1 gnl/MRDRNA2_/MRDRNA2_57142_c0~~gnl/MRDRNA2_/MRDRNA2_57142_c0_seq1.p1  ORF type:complete len:459 (-),score=82.91 gnl/MRDRNA2_/MRDRNA2_57142_c0_seq1:32-1330(-)